MTPDRTDVAIVGAGPAGLSAAIEAARAGASVVVVDEMPRQGGQIYRQLPEGFRETAGHVATRDQRRGRALLDEAAGLPIKVVTGTTVWGTFEARVLELATDDRAWQLAATAVVVATGAYDRPVPVPGWTLPGVFTVGGAQTLLKAQRVLPGSRILLAGAGPLLLVVASQIAAAGGRVVAVVDAVPSWALARYALPLLRNWDITRDGLRYRWSLLRVGAKWMAPAAVTRIEGTDEVRAAIVARVDADWRPTEGSERRIEVDTVCLGYGLVPAVELLRLMGCALAWDPLGMVWVPRRTDDGRTTVPGVYAAGDGAGIGGAAVATTEGRIAGLAAAREVGRLSPGAAEHAMRPLQDRLRRLKAFRKAMDQAYRLRPGLLELTTPDTAVCRCEEVRRRELREAVERGAGSLNQVKAWTRAGMGPCQGRMCAMTTAQVVANALDLGVDHVDPFTPRPPLKPVSIRALIAELEGVDAGSIAGQGVKHEG